MNGVGIGDGDGINVSAVIREVVKEFVQADKMFTAYEVSKAVQERGVRVRHLNLKDEVHQVIHEEAMPQNYTRMLVDVGEPVQPWLYYPMSADPWKWEPLSRNNAQQQQPLMLPAIQAVPLAITGTALPADAYGLDARGRLCIPIKLLKGMNVGPKDKVSAVADAATKTVNIMNLSGSAPTGSDDPQDVSDTTTVYTAEPDGNVRLTSAMLGKAGIAGLQCYRVVSLGGGIQVSGF